MICADLVTGYSGGHYYVEGQIEALCQSTSGAAERCAAITAGGEGNLLGFGGSPAEETDYEACGSASGATTICPTGRLYLDTAPYWYDTTTGCDSYPNSNYDVWQVVEAYGIGINVAGSGQTFFTNTSSLSTGHYYICY